ncbi:MAG: hypothetical protein AAF620_05500 [Bacteroidota bacterium]
MSSKEKKNLLVYSFSGVIILFLVIFSEAKNNSRVIEEVDVDVLDQEGIFFTNDLEVIDLMTEKQSDYVIGVEMEKLDPRILEHRVEMNPFVKNAEVFLDLKGSLKVKVIQSKPIARIFTNGNQDKYIDTDGRILPINARYTARVPLLETESELGWEKNMNESSFGSQVFALLKYLERNEFWKAQIAHILIKKDGEIELYPQVTKQKIEFGRPIDFDKKFSKLMTFYQEILPVKGWNSYERVNVKFKNQIICE